MSTKLANFWDAQSYAAGVAIASDKSNSFINSGAFQTNALLNPTPGGLLMTLPMMEAYDVADAVIDDSDTDIGTGARSSRQQKVPLLGRAFAYGSKDIVRWASGSDPLGDAVAQAAFNVSRNRQTMALSILAGLELDDAAESGYDLTISDTSTALSFNVMADAKAALGDINYGTALIAVMSTADAYTLVKADGAAANAGAMLPSGVGEVGTYLGMNLVINDNVPAGTIYVMRPGFFQVGLSFEAEADRNALSGMGGGQDSIVNRHYDHIVPNGFSYAGAVSPSNATLGLAGSWEYIADSVKEVGMVIVKHS